MELTDLLPASHADAATDALAPSRPEPASHADAATDVLAPRPPADLTQGTMAPTFMGPLGIQGPPSPDAIENARHGTWVMNDYLDGWMLMGANGRPVMRADGSKVTFWFRDIDRLTPEWTPADSGAPPSTKQRPGLAALDSGFDSDWDPAVGRGYRADVIKSARLVSYYLAQKTESEEAARRAVAMLLGDPVMVKEGNIDAFVPKRHNLAAAKAIAHAMWTDFVGAESASPKMPGANALLDNGTNDESGPSRGSFEDVVNAWLEKWLPRVVGPLIGEDSEDVRAQLHEYAEKLKPFARAIVDQHSTITSGKFEVDKLLGPAKVLRDLLGDPEGAAIIMALGTRYRSLLNRKITAKERKEWWMREARENSQNYKEKDLENMRKGLAEKDANGKSMELHHIDGTPEGGLKKMPRYDHRGGPNYRKNHPFLFKN